MKVKSIKFAMLRVTNKFENDRAEVEIELSPKDKPEDAWPIAIAHCLSALELDRQVDVGRRFSELKAICDDAEGREAFKTFIAKEKAKLDRKQRAAYPSYASQLNSNDMDF